MSTVPSPLPSFSRFDASQWFATTVDVIRQRFHTLKDFSAQGRAYFADEFAFAHSPLLESDDSPGGRPNASEKLGSRRARDEELTRSIVTVNRSLDTGENLGNLLPFVEQGRTCEGGENGVWVVMERTGLNASVEMHGGGGQPTR